MVGASGFDELYMLRNRALSSPPINTDPVLEKDKLKIMGCYISLSLVD